MPFLDAEWHELLANFTPDQLSRHAAITLHLISVGWTREGSASCLAVLRVVEEDEAERERLKEEETLAGATRSTLTTIPAVLR